MTNNSNLDVVAFTSFTYSYLPKAMVLAKTLKHFNPSWILTAIICDRKPEEMQELDLSAYFDRIIHIDELDVQPSWIFKHSIVELCTAVKGKIVHQLLEEGWKKVFYFDPDIAIFDKLSELESMLDKFSILITPHQLKPDITKASIIDNEICSLKCGVYNLGFLAVRNDENGKEFSRWWESRLIEFCYDDIPSGLFTDQKWCDLIPCFFNNVHILKDPAYNVSSWNLSNRNLTKGTNGTILVNDSELKFYHFSKVGDVGLSMTIRYAGNNTEVYSLWYWYNGELSEQEKKLKLKNNFDLKKYWHFSKYDSEVEIHLQSRINYRKNNYLQIYYKNPFEFSNEVFN